MKALYGYVTHGGRKTDTARWTIDGSNTEVYEKVRDVLKESGWKLTLLSRVWDYDGTSELTLELKEYVK